MMGLLERTAWLFNDYLILTRTAASGKLDPKLSVALHKVKSVKQGKHPDYFTLASENGESTMMVPGKATIVLK